MRYFQIERFDSKFNNSHSGLGPSPDVLDEWAKQAAKAVHERLLYSVPLFCFAGYSGAAQGTALTLEYYRKYGSKFGMMYVRKLSEIQDTHGVPVERTIQNLQGETVIPVFVDDQISSGSTRHRTLTIALKELKERTKQWGDPVKMDDRGYIQVLSSDIDIRKDY